ncbi:hypothetical protein [Methanoregula sp.]|uniref:hypothetical protein n=1 Tax=Methanoregula sp. TaxID=2052170 RepID=UPI003C75FE2A
MNLRKMSIVLLALLLAAMAMVPMVSAEMHNKVSPDIAQSDTINERSPAFLNDLKNKGSTDEQIAAAIVNYSRVSYINGWTQADDQKYSPLLKQGRSNKSYTSPSNPGGALSTAAQTVSGQYMDSAGMTIYEYDYRGLNGIMHPGSMQCSSTGTIYQYLTNHLGKVISGQDNWVEVGVETTYWNPGQYFVFTYDNHATPGQEWITHSSFTNGNTDHTFDIYVSNVLYSQGYPYVLSWDGQVLRTGYVPFNKGNPTEYHEFVRNDPGSYSSVSTSYVRDSHLYGDTASYYWNRNLPETTYAHNGGPTRSSMYIPSGSLSYRIDTWIP